MLLLHAKSVTDCHGRSFAWASVIARGRRAQAEVHLSVTTMKLMCVQQLTATVAAYVGLLWQHLP